MPSTYDHKRFLTCLFELESALCGTAQRECDGLRADTQLSAAIWALLRATSLFRAALSLMEADLMDACDVIRRACWEAQMLGYEFRLKSASTHAARWHYEKNKHSEADLSKIKAFESSNGLVPSSYGSNYGGLSEVSHPTKAATENSLVTVTALHGNPDSKRNLDQAKQLLTHEDAPGLMYLLIWTVLAEASDMIGLRIKPKDVPTAAMFFQEYEEQNPDGPAQ